MIKYQISNTIFKYLTTKMSNLSALKTIMTNVFEPNNLRTSNEIKSIKIDRRAWSINVSP